jgi:RNA polymerase sigma-70 factor (ECF subfamily)
VSKRSQPLRIAALLQAARTARPVSGVADEQFAEFVEIRLARGELAGPAALHNAGDLLLVCGVLARHEEDIAAFERDVIESLDIALVRIVGSSGIGEVKQRVRESLLVTPHDGSLRISEYAGRGTLRAWVRAFAVRIAMHIRGERRHGAQLDPEVLRVEDDPVLRMLREEYAADLRAAFEDALRALGPGDRTLLRQQFCDGVGVEVLAGLHKVHRVTMSRRLGKIRTRLLTDTRGRLARRIHVETSELDSILRAVMSNFELTLERVLASELNDK